MKRQSAFTIIELLIVVVVIGILSTIVIISYNGIQDRARQTTLSGDLVAATGKLESYKAENGAFPDAITAADLKLSEGVAVQYRKDATTRGYCLTATLKKVSRYVSNDATEPKDGGCIGHGVGGAPAITNISLNPSFETNLTNTAAPAPATITRVAGGQSGDYAMELTRVAGGTAYGVVNTQLGDFSNKVMSASIWARGNGSTAISSQVILQEAGAGYRTLGGIIPSGTIIPATWTRYTVTTATTPADTFGRLRIVTYTGPTVGHAIRYDSLMVVEGATTGAYADGASAGWMWNGTPHNSTSTGSLK